MDGNISQCESVGRVVVDCVCLMCIYVRICTCVCVRVCVSPSVCIGMCFLFVRQYPHLYVCGFFLCTLCLRTGASPMRACISFKDNVTVFFSLKSRCRLLM